MIPVTWETASYHICEEEAQISLHIYAIISWGLSLFCHRIVNLIKKKKNKYRAYPNYSDWQAWPVSVDPYQKQQNAVLIRVYTMSLSPSTSWTHLQVVKWAYPNIRASMVKAEMTGYLGETSSNRKSLFRLRGAYIWFWVVIVFIYQVGPFLLCRFIELLPPLLHLLIIMVISRTWEMGLFTMVNRLDCISYHSVMIIP